MSWYLAVLQKYFDFSGRARRKEYWYFVLFNIIVSIILAVIDQAIGTGSMESGVGLLGSLYSLAVLLPGLGVSVRRLHDTGRSGWWILINLIPLIGSIVFLVFTVSDGDPGPNQYGPSPKASPVMA
ncbi:MAG: DUF805 domain-containing protein [Caldilineaceae bacterium]|nr:DUF805 domain-containing protein [Caldilineaceae bacterium]HRW05364.1 DUF805 domain-containing protein [Caldilineaceae bacterium]